MKRFLSNKSIWIMSIIVLTVAFFLMNYFTPYVADDYNYLTYKIFSSDKKISGVLDIYRSVSNYYFNWSGRIIGHFLTTVFSFMPKYIFDILNTFAYMAVTYFIYAICNTGRKHNIVLYIAVHVLLWLCVPDYGQVVFWMCGSANYLWASLPVLLMIYLYRSYSSHDGERFKSVGWCIPLFVLGIVTGWAMENMSAGMLVIMTLYLVYFYKKKYKIRLSLITGYIGSLIGFALLIFSPGNSVRADFGNGLLGVFLFGVISYYWVMCLCIVCGIWVVLVMFLKDKLKGDIDQKNLSGKILQSVIFVVAAVVSAYCMLAASYSPERTWYIVCVYAIIAVGILYSEAAVMFDILFRKYVCVFMVFVSFFVLTQMADTMIYSRESYIQTAERESLINEQKAAGNRNVTVPIITHAYPLRAKHDALTGLSDITSDSTYWINATIAKYYGVDSVTGE